MSKKNKRSKEEIELLRQIEALFGQRIVAAYLLTGTLGSAR